MSHWYREVTVQVEREEGYSEDTIIYVEGVPYRKNFQWYLDEGSGYPDIEYETWEKQEIEGAIEDYLLGVGPDGEEL